MAECVRPLFVAFCRAMHCFMVSGLLLLPELL
jgi:hypothetical protein